MTDFENGKQFLLVDIFWNTIFFEFSQKIEFVNNFKKQEVFEIQHNLLKQEQFLKILNILQKHEFFCGFQKTRAYFEKHERRLKCPINFLFVNKIGKWGIFLQLWTFFEKNKLEKKEKKKKKPEKTGNF